MENKKDLYAHEGIDKLKDLTKEIDICLFCTNLRTQDGATVRPMSTQEVDDDGCVWFLSERNSEKNREIEEDNQVQLFYSHPGKQSYLVVNGKAEIIINKAKIEELWNPMMDAWFEKGKEDPSITLIKVRTESAYYWNTEGNRMVNFFKFAATLATGKNLLESKEGNISI